MTALPGFNIDAAIVARTWAAGHGHPQPDDRMLAAYGAALLNTLADQADACRDCGKPHRYRRTSVNQTPETWTWADPDDGHTYRRSMPHAQPTAAFLRAAASVHANVGW